MANKTKKNKKTNNDLHYTTQKIKDWATRKPQKRTKVRCPAMTISSCSNKGFRRVSLVKNPMVRYDRAKEDIFVTKIYYRIKTILYEFSDVLSWLSHPQTKQYSITIWRCSRISLFDSGTIYIENSLLSDKIIIVFHVMSKSEKTYILSYEMMI